MTNIPCTATHVHNCADTMTHECSRPADGALIRHRKSGDVEIPMCADELRYLRGRGADIVWFDDDPMVARRIADRMGIDYTDPRVAELRTTVAHCERGLREVRERPFAYDPGAGDVLDMQLAAAERELALRLPALKGA